MLGLSPFQTASGAASTVLTVSTINNKRKKSSERSFEEPPPPVPCTLEEMMTILNKWVADGVVKLPKVSKKLRKTRRIQNSATSTNMFIILQQIAGLFEENSMRRFKTEPWNSLTQNKRYISILSSNIKIELWFRLSFMGTLVMWTWTSLPLQVLP
jgi:hypothetical protein